MYFLSALLVYFFSIVLLSVFGYICYAGSTDHIEAAVKELRKDYADIDFKKYPKTAGLWIAKQEPDTDMQRYSSLFFGLVLVYGITVLPIVVFLATNLGWIVGLAASSAVSAIVIYEFCTKNPKLNVFLLTLKNQAQATQTLIDRYKSLPQSKIDEALGVPLPSEAEMIERLKDVTTLMTLAKSNLAAKEKAVERLQIVNTLSETHPLVADPKKDTAKVEVK